MVGNVHTVWFFNPASNITQISSLRVINDSNLAANIVISGIDDKGFAAPGGTVILSLPANQALSITSQDLENGNVGLGLSGALGNGNGKWRLEINSSASIKVQGVINTASGFLTSISRAVE